MRTDQKHSAVPQPSPQLLERNLCALARTSKALVEQLRNTQPRPDATFIMTDDGVPTLLVGQTGIQMASRRRPLEEAEKLTASIPLETSAGVVIMGFAAGYHVAALAKRMKRTGIIFVYEPDLPLLRAVLERIDFVETLENSNVAVLHDPTDSTAMSSLTTGVEGLLALGVKILDHPPSRARLGDSAQTMGATVASVMRTLRTSIVTTLVQTDITLRNLLQNLDHYTSVPGVKDLADVAKGRPAIVVAAGPSLKRTIDLLAQPGVRDRFVIIAVQTVLKQLLAKGIRPHFVTALDYHEISRRFYEGLTAQDVEGITLICEPKANPAILQAFPGQIRCPADGWLDTLLGDTFKRDMGTLPSGGTVAHLAYYFARHLGCDPVVLTGQDLGFTDGQYYGAGAAIHDVWASELSEFRTLEMLELERILRFGKLLSKREDVLGRQIYTDEQMSTYLMQFERDFKNDVAKGLTTIDATQGGVKKAHTILQPLAEVITSFKDLPPLKLPTTTPRQSSHIDSLKRHISRTREDCSRIAAYSRQAHELLGEAITRQSDQTRVNQIITRLYDLRANVTKLTTAYAMTHIINQAGTLNRFRSDRAMAVAQGLSGLERQKLELERDQTNVSWVADAADQMGRLLDECLNMLAGAPRITRDPAPTPSTYRSAGLDDPSATRRKVWAVVAADLEQGGLGINRSLDVPFGGSRSLLRATIDRLRQSKEVDGILVLSNDPARASQITDLADSPTLIFARADSALMRGRVQGLRASRLWNRSSWRGGLASLTAWDEVLHPAVASPYLRELGVDAILPIGGDWALIDPGLCDAAITRYRERPDTNRLTFAPAPPGIGPCLLDAALVHEMADSGSGAGVFASIGGLLGFLPVAPQLDALGKNACIHISPELRDLGLRCIADSAHAISMLGQAATLCGDAMTKTLASSTACYPAPLHIQFNIVDTAGVMLESGFVEHALRAGGQLFSHTTATFGAAAGADVLSHPTVMHMLAAANEAGMAATQLCTGLPNPARDVDSLATSTASVISVVLTGKDAAREAAVSKLVTERTRNVAGLFSQWIVPRITRCDAAYEIIDLFYQQWLMDAGACVIDPLPAARSGERIEPLPLPRLALEARARTSIRVEADAQVFGWTTQGTEKLLGSLKTASLLSLWRQHQVSIDTNPNLRAAS